MMKKFLTILVVLLVAQSGFGQENENLDSTVLLFELKVEKVKDVNSGDVLDNVKIKVIGTDHTEREFKSDSLGEFSIIKLKPNTSYSTVVWKDGYLNAKGKETTIGKTKSYMFVHEYALQSSHVSCFPIMPIIRFNNNSVEPLIKEEDYNSFLNIMNENKNLIIQITSYRKSFEKTNISQKRIKFFSKKITKMGIDKNRLVLVNGGISIDESIDANYLKFKVISDSFKK